MKQAEQYLLDIADIIIDEFGVEWISLLKVDCEVVNRGNKQGLGKLGWDGRNCLKFLFVLIDDSEGKDKYSLSLNKGFFLNVEGNSNVFRFAFFVDGFIKKFGVFIIVCETFPNFIYIINLL